MVTIYDIAKSMGLAPSTVSKAMLGYKAIPEATRAKVLAAAREMGYIRNNTARFLAKGVSNNIGILTCLSNGKGPFSHRLFMAISDSFQEAMTADGYDLLFISHNVNSKGETYLDNCLSRQVSGVVVFGQLYNPEVVEVTKSGLPVVGFDYIGDDISGVTSDNYRATAGLCQYLIDRGRRNILFIAGDPNQVTDIRTGAFRDTLVRNRIPFRPEMVAAGTYLDPAATARMTALLLEKPNRPDAIMYPDDESALAGYSAAAALGFRVPADLALTGFDGLGEFATVRPRLTTVQQDTARIGAALAKELLRLIRGHIQGKSLPKPCSIEIPSLLIKGETA